MSVFTTILFLLTVSQIYWAWRAYLFATKRIPSPRLRTVVCGVVLVLYVIGFQFNFGIWRHRPTPVHLTPAEALLVGPFLWWAASSLVAFLLVLILAVPKAIAAVVRWMFPSATPSPARRQFLERTANIVVAAPFVAGAYGLLYGRLNLETTTPVIRLPNLPRAFEGFRICQLSDIHIGPWMPAEEIKRYVAIANAQKAEMIVLTGDFVSFDPNTRQAVVDALSGLRAPFGVYASLGNHDAWARVEDSISELLHEAGIPVLRGSNLPISSHGESFNLIGVDFQSPRQFGSSPPVPHLLWNIERFVDPHRVNILLSHNPDTFDRAAELGIELSLAGHTHGGQVALEYISPEIAPSRLVTPYVAGWFGKPGGQLYVNRGIGTTFIPIRAGAPPEITVYKLSRG